MKKSLLVCLAIAGAAFANACNENTIDFGCSKEDNYCAKEDNKDVCYICTQIKDGSFWSKEVCEFGGVNKSVDANGNETAEPVDSIEKANACRTINCVNGINSNGLCACPSSCADKCDDTGKCSDCINGWDADGTCKCPDICSYGCDSNGTCRNSETNCKMGNNKDGSCVKDDKCKSGWKEDGSCACPEELCKNGCNDDGTCKLLICKEMNENGSCKEYLCNGEDKDEDGNCKEFATCKNGYDTNGTCLCPGFCQNGCNIDGSCACSSLCADECNPDGSCKPGKICKEKNEDGSCKEYLCNGEDRDEDGNCKEYATCINGYNSDGSCACSSICTNGCSVDGSCTCSSICTDECNPDGSCKQAQGCVNGWNQDGSCACSDVCFLGCNNVGECKESEKCSCVDEKYCEKDDEGKCKPCHEAWNPDGTCKECKNGWDKDGSCLCPNSCTAGCFGNGICKQLGACVGLNDVAVCNEYDYCKDNLCRCNASNNCELRDTNHNNMDDLNERLEMNETECEHDKVNCESKYGKGSFCDSFIGYKCSVRCTDDSQCLDGFICRSDGRCSADSFTTVWNKDLRDSTLTFKAHNVDSCNIYVCWDWNESVDDKTDSDSCENGNCKIENDNSLPEFKTAKCPIPFEHFDCSGEKDSKGYYLITHDYGKDAGAHNKDSDVIVKIYGEVDRLVVGASETLYCPDNGNNNNHWVHCLGVDEELYPDTCKCDSFHTGYASAGATYNSYEELKSVIDNNYQKGKRYSINARVNCKNDNCEKMLSHDGGCQNCYIRSNGGGKHLSEVSSFGRVGLGWHEHGGITEYYSISNSRGAFQYCYQLKKVSSIDIPDSNKLDMTNIFRGACSFDSPIENWDVSKVVSLRMAFSMAKCQPGFSGGQFEETVFPVFNQPLNKWDVSGVKIMTDTFQCLAPFNQPLNGWNVSKVTAMAGLFGCSDSPYLYNTFNQPLGEWKVDSVNYELSNGNKISLFNNMFLNARYFKQDLSKWNVHKTNSDVKPTNMFYNTLMANRCYLWPANIKNVCTNQ